MRTKQLTTQAAGRALLEVLDAVDHAQRGELSHQERLQLVTLFGTISRRVEGLRLTLVQEADAENSAMITTGASLTTFLQKDGVLTSKQAAGQVFTARDVAANPQVQQAVLTGTISTGQARGIRKAMSDVPVALGTHQRQAVTAELLSRARQTPAPELANQGLAAVKAACPEAMDDDAQRAATEARARRAHRARALRFLPERDGSVEFTGSLPVLQATRFRQLIDSRVETHRRAAQKAMPSSTRPQTGWSADRDGFATTPDQRAADALVSLLEDAASGTGGAPDRAKVVVTVQESWLRERLDQEGQLPTGATVSVGEMRRLACDAQIIPVVMRGESEIVDVGRAARLVTPSIRRILSLRDKGCIFPGCDQPDSACQAHHVIPFHQGGPTAVHNLVLLCQYHHSLVEPPPPGATFTRPSWRVEMHDGRPRVLPPPGVMDPLGTEGASDVGDSPPGNAIVPDGPPQSHLAPQDSPEWSRRSQQPLGVLSDPVLEAAPAGPQRRAHPATAHEPDPAPQVSERSIPPKTDGLRAHPERQTAPPPSKELTPTLVPRGTDRTPPRRHSLELRRRTQGPAPAEASQTQEQGAARFRRSEEFRRRLNHPRSTSDGGRPAGPVGDVLPSEAGGLEDRLTRVDDPGPELAHADGATGAKQPADTFGTHGGAQTAPGATARVRTPAGARC